MTSRARAALALAALVLASSWLGLNVFPEISDDGEPHQSVGFFLQVWGDSLLADAMFVLGSLGAGLLAHDLARRGRPALGLAAGFFGAWLVYFASYQLLTPDVRVEEQGPWEAFQMVGTWGLPGLLVAAVAPVVAARPRLDRDALLAGGAALAFVLLSGAFRLMRYPAVESDLPAAVEPFWSAATPTLLFGALALASLALEAARAAPLPRALLAGLASALAHVALLALALALSYDATRAMPSTGAILAAAATAWAGPAVALAAPLLAPRLASRRASGA